MNNIFDSAAELCKILKDSYYNQGSTLDYDYIIENGRKYFKIVQVSNQRSVHAFVDKSNGDLYKAQSWAAPAKGVRFNLLKDLEFLKANATWHGSYLYR